MKNRALVAYFSASGETARLAKTVAAVSGGSLYEITPAKPYTAADLNWHDAGSRSSVEMKDDHARPSIAGSSADIAAADVIFLGFPIWWYQAPRIIQTFLESYDFSGKTLVPFCTSGGSGLGRTVDILKKSCASSAQWKPGRRFSGRAGSAEIGAWVDSLGL